MATISKSLENGKLTLDQLAQTPIYPNGKDIPAAREGPPIFADLIYHPGKDDPEEGFMTYTGDYRIVYKSHTMTKVKDTIETILLDPPEQLGSLGKVFHPTSDVVLLSSYLYQDSPLATPSREDPRIVKTFQAFAEQEKGRLLRTTQES